MRLHAALITVLTISATSASAEPLHRLKGVTRVGYGNVFKEVLSPAHGAPKRCKVEEGRWNMAIDFVANQSVRLTLVPGAQDAQKAMTAKLAEPDPEKRKAIPMPLPLTLTVEYVNVGIGCVGRVNAELYGLIPPAGLVSIWDETSWLTASYDAFSDSVIQEGESLLKQFVNDWTDSQTLP